MLGLAVALALADSSVVTLALPDIVSRFGVSITDVAWVLISYNLVLAAAAVPAAHLARGRPRLVCAAGLVVFAAASLACGLASSFPVLLAGRCVQAAGAALVVATALVLLAGVEGSEQRAAHVWARAGVLGAALGPAIGGILTQLAGWEAIFLAQAPVALLPLLALWRLRVPRPAAVATAGRPHTGANLALLLGSAALSAALFLLVILLVNGWSIDPAAAGLIVTLMPLAAIAAGRLAPAVESRVVRAVTGFVLIAGGLAALGLLPHAGWGWTVRAAAARRGGARPHGRRADRAGSGRPRTPGRPRRLDDRVAARGHRRSASLVLTPVFTHELARNQERGDEGGRRDRARQLDRAAAQDRRRAGGAADDRRRRRPPPRRPSRVRGATRETPTRASCAASATRCSSSSSAPSRARSAAPSCSPRSSRSPRSRAVALTRDVEP